MASGQYLTPHQKGIVKRYYEHKDTMLRQKLSEIVSELYLCEDPKKAARLWQKARKALLAAGANRVWVEKQAADRNVKGLAEIIGKLF